MNMFEGVAQYSCKGGGGGGGGGFGRNIVCTHVCK